MAPEKMDTGQAFENGRGVRSIRCGGGQHSFEIFRGAVKFSELTE